MIMIAVTNSRPNSVLFKFIIITYIPLFGRKETAGNEAGKEENSLISDDCRSRRKDGSVSVYQSE